LPIANLPICAVRLRSWRICLVQQELQIPVAVTKMPNAKCQTPNAQRPTPIGNWQSAIGNGYNFPHRKPSSSIPSSAGQEP
jgi:hypothetical protein